ncbi:hypothetical protein Glove_170g38 [Diversispora epigaea]|uniref:RanBP2-type domain-containing protein n=1 Tax=Diversispora epigaea TaxID=1348612 RepID=A0A397IPF4_9GLOM|nr:hypothetical protein Glove_170g38 [Diversispora epigaea]
MLRQLQRYAIRSSRVISATYRLPLFTHQPISGKLLNEIKPASRLNMHRDVARRFFGARPRPGDWQCKACGVNNFAYRTECFECGDKVQDREVAPGDWVCPKCNFYNFQSRLACFKCHTPAPSFANESSSDSVEPTKL